MPTPTHKRANPLGTVALVVAVLGLVFAVAKAFLIIGWEPVRYVLPVIGLTLGVGSLFLEGKRKDLGIAAIVVSVVAGTVVPFLFVGLPGVKGASKSGCSVCTPAPAPQSEQRADSLGKGLVGGEQ